MRVRVFNNARGSVYIMGLILLLAGLQFYPRHSQPAVLILYRLHHLTVSVCFAIMCWICVFCLFWYYFQNY